jgi:hypothetical protein
MPIQQPFLEQLHLQSLKSAYRTLAKEYHPDSCAGLPDTLRNVDSFRKATAAYELLSGFIRKRDAISSQQAYRSPGRPLFVASSQHRTHLQATHRGFRQRGHFVKPARNPSEQYYEGPLPTIPLKIGLYLYYRSVISYEAVVRAIIWQRDMRPPFGELASAWGWLAPYDISVIRSATDIPGLFGERAIQLGLLSEAQVRVILTHQKTLQLPLGRYFVGTGLVGEGEMGRYLRELSLHNRQAARKKGNP